MRDRIKRLICRLVCHQLPLRATTWVQVDTIRSQPWRRGYRCPRCGDVLLVEYAVEPLVGD